MYHRMVQTLSIICTTVWYMPASPPPQAAAARRQFGARLQVLRADAGLSQEQLAERVGVDRKTISRTENGHTDTSLDRIVTLAAALQQPPVELFRW